MAKHSPLEVGRVWIEEGGNPAKVFEAVGVAWAESKLDDDASSFCCHGVWALHQDYYDVACARNLRCATREAIKTSKNGTDWSAWDVHPDSQGRTQFASNSPAIRNFKRGKKMAERNRGLRKLIDLKTPLGDIGAPGPDLDFTNPLGPLNPYNPLEGTPSVQNPFGGASLSNPLGGLEALARSVNNISAFFVGFGELVLTPDGWVRSGKLVGGSILVFWGLRVVVRVSTGADPVKAASNTAKKVAETAAVVATVK